MTIRVTHIYRRIDGEWYLVHRHADFPLSDQRARDQGTTGRARRANGQASGSSPGPRFAPSRKLNGNAGDARPELLRLTCD